MKPANLASRVSDRRAEWRVKRDALDRINPFPSVVDGWREHFTEREVWFLVGVVVGAIGAVLIVSL